MTGTLDPGKSPEVGHGMMCPHCGHIVGVRNSGLTFTHTYDGADCPGSGQNPRNPKSDRRTLWNGKPNPYHFDEIERSDG